MAQTSYSVASIAHTARCSGGRHCAAHSITCTSVEPVGSVSWASPNRVFVFQLDPDSADQSNIGRDER